MNGIEREPLTIALVSTQRLWQGGEEQAWQLACGLRARGHRCLIVARQSSPFAVRLAAGGFVVTPLSGKLPFPWRLWSLRSTLRRWAVDVVHFNDAHALTLGGLAAFGLSGVATVASRRAAFAVRSPKQYRHLCQRLLCVSTTAAERCISVGVPPQMVRVVHDGVDPSRMAAGNRDTGRQGLDLHPESILLLSVGSLTACKAHADLLDALPLVVAQYPSVHLCIAGSGKEEPTLRARIHNLQLGAHVTLLGHRQDVPDLIQACDLFVFPSREEGLGSTLIDAMLARRPIVTTSGGGILDVVGTPHLGRSDCAWIAPPAAPAELARAILRALAHPDQCATMIEAAEHRARERFTTDHMVDATLCAYYDLLASRSR
jgi:glycosyltransferase involved in cell wall biosynthesis